MKAYGIRRQHPKGLPDNHPPKGYVNWWEKENAIVKSKKSERQISKKELIEAFASMERHDLKVNTIICTVCGCVVHMDEKTPVCGHLKQLAKDYDTGERMNRATQRINASIA